MSNATQDARLVDEPIVAEIRAGRPMQAAALVVHAYGPELLGYCIAVMRNDEEGREVYSDVIMAFVDALPRFRGDSSIRTFAYAIAWNLVRKHRRSVGRRRRHLELQGTQRDVIDDAIRSSTALYRRTDAKARLATARESLSASEQTLLILRVDRGLSWKEVAHVMELQGDGATARLRKRYERIVDKLRRYMRPSP